MKGYNAMDEPPGTLEPFKPCPFCGGSVYLGYVAPRKYRAAKHHPYTITCSRCNLWFGWDIDDGGRFESPEEAQRKWNQRTEEKKK